MSRCRRPSTGRFGPNNEVLRVLGEKIARQILTGRVDEHGPVDYEGERLPLN
jgi:hypothetical protein